MNSRFLTALLVASTCAACQKPAESSTESDSVVSSAAVGATPVASATPPAAPSAEPVERMTLLPIDAKDVKCKATENKVVELKINGKDIDPSKITFGRAIIQGTTQDVSLTSKAMEGELAPHSVDTKTLTTNDVRVDFGFRRSKRKDGQQLSIAPELGHYKTLPDDDNIFGTSAVVYQKSGSVQIPGTAELQGISTTLICGSFDYRSPDGKNVIRGEFNVPNVVKP